MPCDPRKAPDSAFRCESDVTFTRDFFSRTLDAFGTKNFGAIGVNAIIQITCSDEGKTWPTHFVVLSTVAVANCDQALLAKVLNFLSRKIAWSRPHPTLENRLRRLLQRLIHPPVQFDLIVEGTENRGNSFLLRKRWKLNR